MSFIFSIDPSLTNSGWVYGFLDNESFTIIKWGNIKTSNVDSVLIRLKYIYNKLQNIFSSISIDLILVEELLVNKNPKHSLLLSRANTIILFLSWTYHIKVEFCHCKKSRKIVFNQGNIKKNLIKPLLNTYFDCKIPNQHISDALVLCLAKNLICIFPV